jgi:cardiolipin synthase
VFVATFRWLDGVIRPEVLDDLFPAHELTAGGAPATVLHNAPGGYRPITTAIADLLDGASESLDVVNPYVTDRRMIDRIANAARRGAKVRLFVPAEANNWACAAAQHHHHRALLDAGVRILEYPTMLHAKAFVRDDEDVLAGTCNLEAWSLRRFFEIDLLVRSRELATQFEERFSTPAEVVSTPGRPVVGAQERLRTQAFAIISPLL